MEINYNWFGRLIHLLKWHPFIRPLTCLRRRANERNISYVIPSITYTHLCNNNWTEIQYPISQSVYMVLPSLQTNWHTVIYCGITRERWVLTRCCKNALFLSCKQKSTKDEKVLTKSQRRASVISVSVCAYIANCLFFFCTETSQERDRWSALLNRPPTGREEPHHDLSRTIIKMSFRSIVFFCFVFCWKWSWNEHDPLRALLAKAMKQWTQSVFEQTKFVKVNIEQRQLRHNRYYKQFKSWENWTTHHMTD